MVNLLDYNPFTEADIKKNKTEKQRINILAKVLSDLSFICICNTNTFGK